MSVNSLTHEVKMDHDWHLVSESVVLGSRIRHGGGKRVEKPPGVSPRPELAVAIVACGSSGSVFIGVCSKNGRSSQGSWMVKAPSLMVEKPKFPPSIVASRK